MKTKLDPTTFLAVYQEYVNSILKPTKSEIDSLFATWKKSGLNHGEIERLPVVSPIYDVSCRIKRPESVVDKIIKDDKDVFPNELCRKSIKIMNDTVAGRIVVFFLSNLPLIHNAITKSGIFRISEKSKPIAFLSKETVDNLGISDVEPKPKKSGYNAIHYIVKFKESEVPEDERPWFEIQVKTLTEHVWSEIEHILGYKPDKNPSEDIKRQFKIISNHLCAIDEHFNLLFEGLSVKQQSIIFNRDDILNPENLPAVLESVGIKCQQNEVERILKIFESYRVCQVGQLIKIASDDLINLIRNTFKKQLNRNPSNSEIIASLVATYQIPDKNLKIEAIKTQIDFHNVWETIKGN